MPSIVLWPITGSWQFLLQALWTTIVLSVLAGRAYRRDTGRV